MKKEIKVVADREYLIKIGVNWQREILRVTSQFTRTLIIVPQRVNDMLSISENFADEGRVYVVPVAEGEEQKSLQSVEQLWDFLGKQHFTRADAVIGIGGGATTDLAGFVAATWLRGINWFAFPTTLAGMVDAAIGGKTGINTDSGKNLVGAFYSPTEVLIDTSLLASLDIRDVAAGLAEVIKTGFISDTTILDLLESHSSTVSVRELLPQLIEKSVTVKAAIVSVDFREGRLREILNYGHTMGHAIEKHANFRLRHGEAIAIGLVFAAELSHELAGLDSGIVDLHRSLLTQFGLPISYPRTAWKDLADLLRSDKKNRGVDLRFIGISALGKPIWLEKVDIELLATVYERISE